MRGTGKKILVVDDDIGIRELLGGFLCDLGYDIICASDGSEAIKLIKNECYDIIITDYKMPELDGLELIKKVRSLNLSLPIIGVSASGNEKEFLDVGADVFVAKPFLLKELLYALKMVSPI